MNQSIVIVNIALGDPGLMNEKTILAMKESGTLILRTLHNPIVSWLEHENIRYSTLDSLYNTVDDFDQLSAAIADYLWSLTMKTTVTYAVPDLMTDCSVRTLYQTKPKNGQITVIPGVGVSDLYQSYSLPLTDGSDLRTVSAADFLNENYDPNISVLITELDNFILAGELKLRLSAYLEDEYQIYILHEQITPVLIPLFELDRQKCIDHLSAVFVPGLSYMERSTYVFDDLLRIMDRLRASDGCPWDRVQTHTSLRPYMIEEAWECTAAIDQNDYEHLSDELGDLLFQIVFHSSIGKTYDEFTIIDVINSICRKMIRRHPHIFSEHSATSAVFSSEEWEKLKRFETGSSSILESLDDVSTALPSLKYASKVIKKLALLPSCKRKTDDISLEIKQLTDRITVYDEESIGYILFLYAELCFSLNLDGELLLHHTVTRIKKCMQTEGNQLEKDGKTYESLTFPELGVYLSHVEDEIE